MPPSDLAPAPTQLLHHLPLRRLPDTPGPAHAEARAFCLATIRQTYAVPYRPDWHADLDSLLGPPETNHYATRNDGAFWTLRDHRGAIAGTAALRHLAWKPGLLAPFPHYGTGRHIGSLWRLYLRPDHRRLGLGRRLATLAETEARRLGYATLYLHAHTSSPAATPFWLAQGYTILAEENGNTHFQKPPSPSGRQANTSGPFTPAATTPPPASPTSSPPPAVSRH